MAEQNPLDRSLDSLRNYARVLTDEARELILAIRQNSDAIHATNEATENGEVPLGGELVDREVARQRLEKVVSDLVKVEGRLDKFKEGEDQKDAA